MKSTVRSLVVVAGGRTVEHDLSLASAQQLLRSLDGSEFATTLVPIDCDGRWPFPAPLAQFDYALPLVHGAELAGLLAVLDVPLLGERARGVAASVDKTIARRLLADAGVPVLPAVVITRVAFAARPAEVVAHVEREIGYPCIVKPACGAASVGISVADSRQELVRAIVDAATFDSRLLVEPFLDAREIEVEVVAGRPSNPGELVFRSRFHDRLTKSTPGAVELIVPAMTGSDERERIRALAVAGFHALSLESVARVELLKDRDTGEVWVNEVNPFPSFAPTSVFPRILEASGITTQDVIRKLALAADARARDDFRTRHAPL